MDPTRTHDSGPERISVAAPDAPQIEGFRCLRLIGRGGMGVVWEAEQLATKRRVALKLLPGHLVDDLSAARFRREVELASQLEHPGIARVYDSGLSRGQHYYCMQYIEGLPLARYADKNRLPRRARVELILKVCEAVQFAHQRGVIHRDLKPSNILVTEDGQPHVLDFGLAKLLQPDGAADPLSMAGEILGTPIFMAPEQAAGDSAGADTRADVYSLGVMLYELITGLYPHDVSGTNYDILKRVVEEEPRPPRQADRTVDAEMEAILLKAVAREKEERYAFAGALAEDLTRYLQGEPLAARKATTAYFLSRRLRRYRGRVAVILLVLLSFLSLGVISVHQIKQQRDAALANLRLAHRNYAHALVERAERCFAGGENNEGMTLLAAAQQTDPAVEADRVRLLRGTRPEFPCIVPEMMRDPHLRWAGGTIEVSGNDRYLFYFQRGKLLRRRIPDGATDELPDPGMRHAAMRASPSGRYLALLSGDADRLRIIDFDHPTITNEIPHPHHGPFSEYVYSSAMAFSPDESEFAYFPAETSKVVFCSVPSMRETGASLGGWPESNAAYNVTYTPDGEHLLLGRRGYVEMVRRRDLRTVALISGGEPQIMDVTETAANLPEAARGWSGAAEVTMDAESGRMAFSCGEFIFIYDWPGRRLLTKTRMLARPPARVRFLHGGRFLQYVTADPEGGILEAESGRLVQSFPVSSEWGVAVCNAQGWLFMEGRVADLSHLRDLIVEDPPPVPDLPFSRSVAAERIPEDVRGLMAASTNNAWATGWKKSVRVSIREPENLAVYANNAGDVVLHDAGAGRLRFTNSPLTGTRWLYNLERHKAALRLSIFFDGRISAVEIHHASGAPSRIQWIDPGLANFAVSEDERLVAVSDYQGQVHLFRLPELDALGQLTDRSDEPRTVAFAPTGHVLFVRQGSQVTRYNLDRIDQNPKHDLPECAERFGYHIEGVTPVWRDFAVYPPLHYGWSRKGQEIAFEFDPAEYERLTRADRAAGRLAGLPAATSVCVKGEFNNWSDTPDWQMRQEGDGIFRLTKPVADLAGKSRWPFKFFVNGSLWLEPPRAAINREKVGIGRVTFTSANLHVDLDARAE
jgi:hypothetical protein